jgi:c-di-GMP-binding flagellar brake protein YcgR
MENLESRRQYKRALFTIEDDIKGIFSIPGSDIRPISTYILNLGQGGTYFIINQSDESHFQPGTRLVLVQIKGHEPLQYLVNVDVEIKWIFDHNIMEYVGAGCQFLNISQSSRDQIKSFVEAWNQEATPE